VNSKRAVIRWALAAVLLASIWYVDGATSASCAPVLSLGNHVVVGLRIVRGAQWVSLERKSDFWEISDYGRAAGTAFDPYRIGVSSGAGAEVPLNWNGLVGHKETLVRRRNFVCGCAEALLVELISQPVVRWVEKGYEERVPLIEIEIVTDVQRMLTRVRIGRSVPTMVGGIYVRAPSPPDGENEAVVDAAVLGLSLQLLDRRFDELEAVRFKRGG